MPDTSGWGEAYGETETRIGGIRNEPFCPSSLETLTIERLSHHNWASGAPQALPYRTCDWL